METLAIVLPVVLMLALGVIFRIKKIFSEQGIDNVKTYITCFALPFTIFNALATATYNMSTLKVVIVMLIVLTIGLIAGFMLKFIIKDENLKKYMPFLTTVYEGGMIAYPLYQNLCGEKNLSNVAVIDIAGCIFCFGMLISVLQTVDTNRKIVPKEIALNAIKNPTFIAMVAGVMAGLTGFMDFLLKESAGNVYVKCKDMIVAPLTPMILIVVGFSISFEKSILADCIKTIIARFILQVALLLTVLCILKSDYSGEYKVAALVLYFFSPPSFGMPSYVKNKEGSKYMSTAGSLYMVITIIAYAFIAAHIK